MTNSTFKAKLLFNLKNKNQHKKTLLQKGFTLVELMVVIVIVGILSAVALPNFLNQTKKAAATEAKQQVSNVFKQAHAYVLENGTLGTVDTTCAAYAGTLTAIADGASFGYVCGGTQAAFTVTASGDTTNANTNGVTVTLTGNTGNGTVTSLATTGT